MVFVLVRSPMMNKEWQRLCPEEDGEGFIYITKTQQGRWYIGKKSYHRRSKKKIVGASDWKKYYGSSKKLKEDIKGGMDYERFIVFEGCSKSELSYVETKLQLHFDASIRDDSYNSMLNFRLNTVKTKANHAECYGNAVLILEKIIY